MVEVCMSSVQIKRLRRKLLGWFAKNRAPFLWRRRPTPYRVLVAEVMLQQTQAERVAGKYRQFLRRYPTVTALAKARTDELLALWSGLGYNRRALYLRACAQAVLQQHGGRLPVPYAQLVALPGVGPYTARAINVFARNRDEVCVDTNVRRVLMHELGLPMGTTVQQIEVVALQVLPKGRSREWHSALMDYGRLVATARRTGVRPLGHRPERFLGSRRWYRGKTLQTLVTKREVSVRQLARALDLAIPKVEHILGTLQHDGLVRRAGARVLLPR